MSDMETKVRVLTERHNKARRDLQMERWRRQVLLSRRWTRLGTVILAALRNPLRLVRLPYDIAKVLFRKVPAPPMPVMKADGSVVDTAPDDAKIVQTLIADAKAAIEAEEHVRAWDLLEQADRERPMDLGIIRMRRTQAGRVGDPITGLEISRQMVAVSDTAKHRLQLRVTEGQVRELDPSWLPPVAGRSAPLTPAHDRRILHFLKGSFPHRVAGATTRSRYTLLAQREAGLDPVAVTDLQFPRNEDIHDFEILEEVDGIRHHRLDAGPGLELRLVPNDQELTLWTTLADRIVRQERPAILHAASGSRGYENAVVASALGRHHQLPVVYEVRSFHEATWTADLDLAENAPLYRMRVARENEAMFGAAAVVTLAGSMRDDLVERGVDPDNITIIPNAVDASHFDPAPPDLELKRSLGLGDRTVVGYISNLSRREGVDFLLRATKQLVDRGHDVACLVCGDGPEREGLLELAGELGLGDRAVLPGAVPHEDIHRYYGIIDVFVIPRRNDRAARFVTPIKPFEAMALERTIVVSDLPALREIVDPPTRGLAFEPEDADALAATIEPLITDPERRRSLGKAAREWVVRERSWEANARRYVELYDKVVAR
ncbi:MAG: glycosyltransferase [Actinomycetota bacterium]